MIVIVPCGGKKRSESCTAREMYTGPFHKGCMRYALTLAPPEDVYILSAKYGLLRLSDEIEPYDLRMGQVGCVASKTVLGQARALSLETEDRVVCLGGGLYREVCKKVWPGCETPLLGVGGIGHQLKWLKEHS
jgi:hypothetical protein